MAVLLTMPILVLNMGAEMIYILEQRLNAQQVLSDKSQKVLSDVVRTMYNPKFIEELFKPQQMYSSSSIRQIFDRLAHSSIMRLNEASMDKLFDLMSMGLKYQLLSLTCPQQILQVTTNHLESVMAIIGPGAVAQLVDDTLRSVITAYRCFTIGEFYQLKQELARFFMGRRVKVSLFLSEGLQNLDGSIVLSHSGMVPPGTLPPGTVRYFEANGDLLRTAFVPLPASEGTLPNHCMEPTILLDNSQRCTLGFNLYSNTRPHVSRSPAEVAGLRGGGSANAASADAKADTVGEAKAGAPAERATAKSTARAELNLLAHLMGIAADASDGGGKAESKPFRISLWAEDPFDGSSKGGSGGAVRTIHIDGAAERKDLSSRVRDLDLEGGGGKHTSSSGSKTSAKSGPQDPDDLLSLMDSV